MRRAAKECQLPSIHGRMAGRQPRRQPLKPDPKSGTHTMQESLLLPASAPASAIATVNDTDLMREVAELVVSALNLDTPAADIQPDAPLYGDGLGLDSIDILEIALVLSKHYGLQLRADHEDNTAIFQSLRSLTEHIALQRNK